MNTNMIALQFDGSRIRVIEIGGEPWFVGKDVAAILGYANPQEAVRDHCKNRRPLGVSELLTQALDPQTVIIPERDLYRLIMRSKLPTAERFEEWVVGEVLPQIRKAGSYSGNPRPTQVIQPQPVRDLLMIGRAMGRIKGINESLVMAYTLDAIERTTGLPTALMSRALPGIEPVEAACLNATQVGEPLGMNARMANAMLEKIGLQCRDETKAWKLTEAGTDYGEMKPFYRNGHSGYEIRWKSSAVDLLRAKVPDFESGAASVGRS